MSNEWQPIETAPKDGKSILVYGGTMFSTGSMDDTGWPMNYVTMAAWSKSDNFWNAGDAHAHDEYYVARPTHWMPLPEPPK